MTLLRKLFSFRRDWYAPLLLAGLAALTCLPLAGRFGAYRDAWHILRTGRAMEWTYLFRLFQVDRPFVGLAYMAYYRLLGDDLWRWQLAFFVLLCANALVFWSLLRTLWPDARGLALAAAALFVVYPGFLQHPDAVTYIILLTGTLGALLSLWWMLWSLRQDNLAARIGGAAAAVLLAAAYLFLVEFLIGFEAVRLLLLWQTVDGQVPSSGLPFWPLRRRRQSSAQPTVGLRLRRVALRSLPYLLAVLTFLVWRVFFFAGGRPTTDAGALVSAVAAAPGAWLLKSLLNLLGGTLLIGAGAWIVPPSLLSTLVSPGTVLTGLAIGLLAGAFALRAARPADDSRDPRLPRLAALAGFLALGLTYLPLALLDRPVSFGPPLTATFDRYTFQSSFGAALLLAGLIWWLTPSRGPARAWLLAGLVTLGVATHFWSATLFARSWENARQYFWQLSWRAPQLEKGTLLVGYYADGALTEGYHLGYPANLIYYPESYYPDLSAELLTDASLYDFVMHSVIGQERRTVPMLLDYHNPLLAFLPGEGACLQVVDGRRPVLSAAATPAALFAAPYSRIELIQTDAGPAVPPASIFGQEPPHDWCYYYQKASLAVQRGEYESAAGLGDQARAAGFAPADPVEWLPFAEAYVYVGDYDSAAPLLEQIGRDAHLTFQICRLLDQGVFVPEMPARAAHAAYLAKVLCGK